MNNLKSYDEFLFEASKAKEIEDKVNDLGDPKDDKPEAEKSMKDSSEGPKEPKEEKIEDVKEMSEYNEKHDKYDDRLVNMTIGKVLDYLKTKDPNAYKDIEAYLEKNFKDLTSADESWFTTMTS